ncbi:MAG: lipid-A-disaccharide synthase N-terminal domain-containing protein [Planctomycetota bacterium]
MSPRAKWGAIVAVCAALIGLSIGFWLLLSAVNRTPVLPELSTANDVRLVDVDGRPRIAFVNPVGESTTLEPEEYFTLVLEERREMGFWQKFMMKLFNVTSLGSMVFVAIGLAGQILFAGRLVVQWLATERSRKSVIPTAFWWMALGGASMLIVYFIWRKDIVGILGQSTGWIIYTRNLYFIYFAKPKPDDSDTSPPDTSDDAPNSPPTPAPAS